MRKYFHGTLIDDILRQIRMQSSISIDELFPLDQAITILIPLVEGLSELGLLRLSCHMPSHKRQSRLLKL